MPTKKKTYQQVVFTPEVIQEAVARMRGSLPSESKRTIQLLIISLSAEEEWQHDNEEEFFADYRRGFNYVHFLQRYQTKEHDGAIELIVSNNNTTVSVSMRERPNVEAVLGVFEAAVDKCRLPKQPKETTPTATDWITEGVSKIETHRPVVARKIRLALSKLNSEDIEEWQNATMLIRDAWIELTQWLCEVNGIDTSDISPDAVIDRLKKLKIDKTDERLFNLARASFNLYSKHHKRDIELDTAAACVLSTIVSMKTVIKESFNATG